MFDINALFSFCCDKNVVLHASSDLLRPASLTPSEASLTHTEAILTFVEAILMRIEVGLTPFQASPLASKAGIFKLVNSVRPQDLLCS